MMSSESSASRARIILSSQYSKSNIRSIASQASARPLIVDDTPSGLSGYAEWTVPNVAVSNPEYTSDPSDQKPTHYGEVTIKAPPNLALYYLEYDMAERPEHIENFPISAVRSTLPQISEEDGRSKADSMTPDLIADDGDDTETICEASSQLSTAPIQSAPPTPTTVKTPEQRALDDLLKSDSPADDHLTKLPGRPRPLLRAPRLNMVQLETEYLNLRTLKVHDPEKDAPWFPDGSETSALRKAHGDHKDAFELQRAANEAQKAMQDPQLQPSQRRSASALEDSSWWKMRMVERAPEGWVIFQYEYNARSTSATPAPAEPLESITSASSTILADGSASEPLQGIDNGIIEPLRKIVANGRLDANVKTIGTPRADRGKVFAFAQRFRDYCTGKSAGGIVLPNDGEIQEGEEYEIVDGDRSIPDELEELFHESEADPPIGVYDEMETCFFYGRKKQEWVGEARKGRWTNEQIDACIREECGYGKEELDEQVEMARADLVSRRKLLPPKNTVTPVASSSRTTRMRPAATIVASSSEAPVKSGFILKLKRRTKEADSDSAEEPAREQGNLTLKLKKMPGLAHSEEGEAQLTAYKGKGKRKRTDLVDEAIDETNGVETAGVPPADSAEGSGDWRPAKRTRRVPARFQ